jgi:hypothetical protein
MKDNEAFRESFIKVCLDITAEERIIRVRNYQGYDSDYYLGDIDRDYLGK